MTASTAPSTSAILRERTGPDHRRTEERPLHRELARGRLAPALWVAYLEQQLLVARALDHRLARVSAPAVAGALAAAGGGRTRVPDLEGDLACLGGTTDPAPLPATADAVATVHDASDEGALGMLYVVEGSTNGGRFLRRRAAAALNLDPESRDGLRYLDPYGDAQSERWASFKAGLDGGSFTPAAIDRLGHGAVAMFSAVGAIADAVWQRHAGEPA